MKYQFLQFGFYKILFNLDFCKNLLYVYFWRWTLWKVFEQDPSRPGVVSFISVSSYIDGVAFSGMREHIRRICDEFWVIDLGGEGRGSRKSENVFAIQTPVAIGIAFRGGKIDRSKPAKIHYIKIDGSRGEKLAALDKIRTFRTLKWQTCPKEWKAPFRPAPKNEYFRLPLLLDLMPWQHTGCEFKRTWPISFDQNTLEKRWRTLLKAKHKSRYFRETRDRKVNSNNSVDQTNKSIEKPISELPENAAPPPIVRYSFRALDKQWILADSRLGDYLRPVLWSSYSERQIFFSSSIVLALGKGPGLVCTPYIPDRHYFAGRGGKDIIPFYRTSDCSELNILPGLIDRLASEYKNKVSPQDFVSYLYGIISQPGFTSLFSLELASREIRIPITKSPILFEEIRSIGAYLIWLHTYGERFIPKGKRRGTVPRGKVKCAKPISTRSEDYPKAFDYDESRKVLRVGSGEFKLVERKVFDFGVSGLKVVQSWLKYRMKNGAGRKSSPLDDIRPDQWTSQFTTELLELLWILEKTVEVYPRLKELLETVVKSSCFHADELPPVPEVSRKAPAMRNLENDLFNNNKRNVS